MNDLVTKTIPQLGSAADLDERDRLVMARGSGPAASFTLSLLQSYLSSKGFGPAIVRSTRPELDAVTPDLTFALGEVRADPSGDVPGGNGVYSWSGSEWVWISDLIPEAVATALSGQAFAQRPSLGFFRGRPVLSTKVNVEGRAVEVVTSDGLFVPGPDGRLASIGQRRPPDYLAGSAPGVSALADTSICYILIIMGQSNGEGVMPPSEGAIIASEPVPGYAPYALMPATGVRMDTRDGGSAKAPPSKPAFITLAPLVEAADANIECYETSASSAVNHLIAFVEGNTGRRIRVAAFTAALGGAKLLELLPGSTTYGWFVRGLTDMVSAIRSQGWRPVLLPITWRQGESDQASDTNPAEYAAGLLRLRAALETDARAILNEQVDLKLLVDAPQLWDEPTDNDLVAAQQAAAARDPKILLGPPYYQHPRTIGQPIHLSAQGQNKAGVNVARAIYDEVFAGGYTPFQPHDWWFEPGRTAVTLRFPRAPLFDETAADVEPTGLPNYKGLVFDDRSGAAPTIIGHSINGSFLTLMLSGPSAGPRPRIANATMPNVGNTDTPGPIRGARSLLRSARGPVNSIYGGAQIFEWSRPFVLNL